MTSELWDQGAVALWTAVETRPDQSTAVVTPTFEVSEEEMFRGNTLAVRCGATTTSGRN